MDGGAATHEVDLSDEDRRRWNDRALQRQTRDLRERAPFGLWTYICRRYEAHTVIVVLFLARKLGRPERHGNIP